MRIGYLSDIHLEFHADGGRWFFNTLPKVECDVLVVAGDLGIVDRMDVTAVLHKLTGICPNVVLVLGNHEYYYSSMVKIEAYLRQFAQKFPTVKIVSEVETFSLFGVTFLAGTMWFPYRPDNVLYRGKMADFKYVRDLEPEVYTRNRDFDIALQGLDEAPAVVVTHHLPSSLSVDLKYRNNSLNRFFVGGEYHNFVEDHSNIKAWIHGHGHDPVSYTIGKTQVASNPFGYPFEPTCGEPKIQIIEVG